MIRPPNLPRPWRPLLAALVASISAALLLAGAFDLWQRQSLAQWESRVQRSLSELRAQIEAEFYGDLHLATRMAAFVDGSLEPDAGEFDGFARSLLASGQHAVRYFAYAPGHTIRLVHPAAGNQAQVGRILSRDTLFAREVSLLQQQRSIRIAGPYEPVEGTRELVIQVPLTSGTGNGNAIVTGQLNASIDLDQIYRRAEVFRFAESIDLVIRLAHTDSEGVLFGRESILEASPIRAVIDFPGLSLELAAVPHGGWSTVEPVPDFIVPLATLMLLAVFATTWHTTRQTQRLQASEARMRATGEQLTTLLTAMPSLVSIVDANGRCTGLFGGNGPRPFHIDSQQLIGREINQFLPPDKARLLLAASNRALQENALQMIEFSISGDEARIFAGPQWPERIQWFRASIAPLHSEHEQLASTLWVTDNITEAREAERAVQHSHNRYRQLTAAVQQVVFETDVSGRIRFINQAWKQITGRDGDDPLGHPWISLIHPEDREALHAAFVDLMTGRSEHVQQDARLSAPSESPFWVSANLIPLSGNGNDRLVGAIGTLFDITDRKRSESTIRHQALHDPLTGIPNRLLLIERLEQALGRQRRQNSQLAVLYIDLDDFKSVNDHQGHLAGDQVLRLAAQRLREQVRDTDTVARIGGDEFVVLLESAGDTGSVEGIANKLISAMSEPFELSLPTGRVDCRIGASIGIALAPRDGSTVDALLHQADSRLYRAKAGGKGISHSAAS